jgi:hypothetical protein
MRRGKAERYPGDPEPRIEAVGEEEAIGLDDSSRRFLVQRLTNFRQGTEQLENSTAGTALN